MLSYVEAALRRRDAHADILRDDLILGELKLNIPSALALWDSKDLLLSKKEFSILLVLAQNHGKPISPETLYEAAWKAPLAGDRNSLWRHISSLKRKLSAVCGDKAEITYNRMTGYALVFPNN
jgi:DNA-binding response OmpR family regulator